MLFEFSASQGYKMFFTSVSFRGTTQPVIEVFQTACIGTCHAVLSGLSGISLPDAHAHIATTQLVWAAKPAYLSK